MLGAMIPTHSTPGAETGQPCWHCISFDGMTHQGAAALCNAPGHCRVRSMPQQGCCAWERAVGTDDEPGPPGGGSCRSGPVVFGAPARDARADLYRPGPHPLLG
jgi:hypothetical protein